LSERVAILARNCRQSFSGEAIAMIAQPAATNREGWSAHCNGATETQTVATRRRGRSNSASAGAPLSSATAFRKRSAFSPVPHLAAPGPWIAGTSLFESDERPAAARADAAPVRAARALLRDDATARGRCVLSKSSLCRQFGVWFAGEPGFGRGPAQAFAFPPFAEELCRDGGSEQFDANKCCNLREKTSTTRIARFESDSGFSQISLLAVYNFGHRAMARRTDRLGFSRWLTPRIKAHAPKILSRRRSKCTKVDDRAFTRFRGI
jgi:hypothetical protein